MDPTAYISRYISPSSWCKGYPQLPALIRERNLRTGAEIGVARGGHAHAILSSTAVDCLYGVDPYRHDPNWHDPMNVSQPEFDEIHTALVAFMATTHGSRYTHIRETSRDAAAIVPDSLDFVYIDANHTREAVAEDVSLWAARVRPGGIISGHDYRSAMHPGVSRAVDEWAAATGRTIHAGEEYFWWCEK